MAAKRRYKVIIYHISLAGNRLTKAWRDEEGGGQGIHTNYCIASVKQQPHNQFPNHHFPPQLTASGNGGGVVSRDYHHTD